MAALSSRQEKALARVRTVATGIGWPEIAARVRRIDVDDIARSVALDRMIASRRADGAAWAVRSAASRWFAGVAQW